MLPPLCRTLEKPGFASKGEEDDKDCGGTGPAVVCDNVHGEALDMMHLRMQWMALGVVLSLLLAGTGAAEPGPDAAADMGTLRWDGEILSVRYEAVYKLGPLSLYRPAQAWLVLGEGTFLAPGAKSPVRAWIIRIDATPPDGKAERSRRIFFRSHFTAAISKKTYRMLSYEKRVEEHIRMVVLRSRKDFLEQGLYLHDSEGVTARIRRVDRLADTVRRKDIRLEIPGAGRESVQSFVNLPALVGRALFQDRYAAQLAERTTPLDAYVIMSVNVYRIHAQVRADSVDSPYTGPVPATRVDTTVVLKSRAGEVAPFGVWFADPSDLSPEVRKFCHDVHIQSFPAGMMLDLTLGKLIVRATEAVAGPGPRIGTRGLQGKERTSRHGQ